MGCPRPILKIDTTQYYKSVVLIPNFVRKHLLQQEIVNPIFINISAPHSPTVSIYTLDVCHKLLWHRCITVSKIPNFVVLCCDEKTPCFMGMGSSIRIIWGLIDQLRRQGEFSFSHFPKVANQCGLVGCSHLASLISQTCQAVHELLFPVFVAPIFLGGSR